jgi:hypothetical protein
MLIIELTPSDSLGDFNHDHIIDSADYAVWRKGFGTTYSASDYDHWRAHFGQSIGSGATAFGTTAPVPESAPLALFSIAISAVSLSIRRR